MMAKAGIEVHYVWKEFAKVEAEDQPRLLTPWADPMVHEDPFDYLFDSVEAALEAKREYGAVDEDWVLCEQMLTPVDLG